MAHAVCVYCAGAERSAAVVSSAAEEALKAAVYDGAACSSHQGGPAHVLLAYLEQPFTDLRIAAYRSCPCLQPCQCSEPHQCLVCLPELHADAQGKSVQKHAHSVQGLAHAYPSLSLTHLCAARLQVCKLTTAVHPGHFSSCQQHHVCIESVHIAPVKTRSG